MGTRLPSIDYPFFSLSRASLSPLLYSPLAFLLPLPFSRLQERFVSCWSPTPTRGGPREGAIVPLRYCHDFSVHAANDLMGTRLPSIGFPFFRLFFTGLFYFLLLLCLPLGQKGICLSLTADTDGWDYQGRCLFGGAASTFTPFQHPRCE